MNEDINLTFVNVISYTFEFILKDSVIFSYLGKYLLICVNQDFLADRIQKNNNII